MGAVFAGESRQPLMASDSLGVTELIPATAAKDNWSPTLAADSGLHKRRKNSAAARADQGSFSRPATGASSAKAQMIHARSTDGLPPTARANTTITGRHTAARRRGSAPVSRLRRPTRKHTCIPDTAIRWATPERFRAV